MLGAMAEQSPQLFRLNSMARQLGVTCRWLRSEVEAGRIPCVRAERQRLFDPETVKRVLLERAREPVGTTEGRAPV